MQGGDQLTKLLEDARRFIMYHKGPIERYPLQSYASALVFSPTGSAIRKLFQHDEPEGITVKPEMSSSWGACLQTLEGHSQEVNSVAFPHDSTKLASASYDNTVKLWDASSGECLQTFTGHSHPITSVAFSHDSTKLASASWDKTVRLWDASSGTCLQTFDVGKASKVFSFGSTDSCLYTDRGAIAIDTPYTLARTTAAEPVPPLYLGASLSSDRTWIMHASEKMLWIPSECRPSCSSVRGITVAMGVGSGRVWTCSVDLAYISICL
jgi:WD40 repeat protein